MTETEELRGAHITEMTADIVAAYVANNPVPAANLAELIATVHGAVAGLSIRPSLSSRRKRLQSIPNVQCTPTTSSALKTESASSR